MRSLPARLAGRDAAAAKDRKPGLIWQQRDTEILETVWQNRWLTRDLLLLPAFGFTPPLVRVRPHRLPIESLCAGYLPHPLHAACRYSW